MPRLPIPRNGQIVSTKSRDLPFSLWPVKKSVPRFSVQSCLFSANLWPLLRRSVEENCPAKGKKAAHAFLEQADDFYQAATSAGITAAKPLLLYYCFMNLVKAYILTVGQRRKLDNAQHGLSERGAGLAKAKLIAHPSSSKTVNVFDEFLTAFSGKGLLKLREYPVPQLIPQVVTGHQLWTSATSRAERFIAVESMKFFEDRSQNNAWLRMYVFADKFTRVGISHKRFLEEAQLKSKWHEVRCDRTCESGRRLVCFEQLSPCSYVHRAVDVIPELVHSIQRNLWATVLLQPPYRQYYVHLARLTHHKYVLPQLASIYAITFYLGSITRYRPHRFDSLAGGKYGPFIEAFLGEQPGQFMYLLASDFVKREVTRPSTVS